jgi:hypothetical protein
MPEVQWNRKREKSIPVGIFHDIKIFYRKHGCPMIPEGRSPQGIVGSVTSHPQSTNQHYMIQQGSPANAGLRI